MKALQITGLEEMAVIEMEKPEPKSGEVLLKMNYVGFCGSDLNTFLGRNPMVNIRGHITKSRINWITLLLYYNID